MAPTFFFYDLETSGFDPKTQRILQFAGQRTSLELAPIGEPVNFLNKPPPDVLPAPGSILVSGITPRETVERGLSERDASAKIMAECFTPDTIATGFNNIRFDDEFSRYLFYRNFRDAYVWHWQDGRSRWDLLDAVRLIRALRPGGLEWPHDAEGAPTNSLAALAEANHVVHRPVHDALGDVKALIALARLLRAAQPRMFDYLVGVRSKAAVAEIVNPARHSVFMYASGSFGKLNQFVTAAVAIGTGENDQIIVYDLRRDPALFLDMSVRQLRDLRFATREDRARPGFVSLPAKALAPGRCPSVAPYATLRDDDAGRPGIAREAGGRRLDTLLHSGLPQKLTEVFQPSGHRAAAALPAPDAALYSGFINGQADRAAMARISTAGLSELSSLQPTFTDQRLSELWPRYLGRNAPDTLTSSSLTTWQQFVAARRQAQRADFKIKLARAAHPAGGNAAILAAIAAWAAD